MKTVLLLLLCLSSLWARSSSRMANYFFAQDAENSAIAEASVAQVTSLGAIQTNPANGAFFANRSGETLFLSSGASAYSINNSYSEEYENRGTNFQIGYFPEHEKDNFSWGVVFSVNSDELLIPNNEFEIDNPFGGVMKLGEGDVNLGVTQTLTTFSFAWFDILSVGIGFDISSFSNSIDIVFDSTFVDLFERDSETFEEDDARVAMNLGVSAQYRFLVSDNLYIEPAVGASLLQIGSDSLEIVTGESTFSNSETIPTTSHIGGRVSLGFKEYFQFSTLFDRYFNNIEDNAYTDSYGVEFGFLPLGWIRAGILKENNRFPREELHGGVTIGYKAKELHDFFQLRGHHIRKPKRVDNLHLLYSFAITDNINEEHIGRDGQQLHQLSCAIDFKKRKGPVKSRKKTYSASWQETEMELVE